MKLYTCCPHEDCGAFQSALSFLHSWGIEPSMEYDDNHYFEFKLPKKFKKRKQFLFELTSNTSSPICKCGIFLDGRNGNIQKFSYNGKSREFCHDCILNKRITPDEMKVVIEKTGEEDLTD